MLVREIMERTGLTSFGLARMLITDGLTEMALLGENFITESSYSLRKGRRYYTLPAEAVRVTDILVKNHMNTKGEYRSIPRLLNKPKIKDVDNRHIKSNILGQLGNQVSASKGEAAGNVDDTNAREYGYYYEGNQLMIVEKEHYTTSTGNVVEDINAYQKATSEWVSPSISANGYVVVRYTRAPIVDIIPSTSVDQIVSGPRRIGAYNYNVTAGAELLMEICNFTDLTDEADWDSEDVPYATVRDDITSTNWGGFAIAAGDYVYVQDSTTLNGLWEVVQAGSPTVWSLFVKRTALNQSAKSDPIQFEAETDMNENKARFSGVIWGPHSVKSLLGDQEAYWLPISAIESQALLCYIRGAMAENMGEIDKKMYYQKEFEKKLEKQRTARYPGPRMVSSGPFALK